MTNGPADQSDGQSLTEKLKAKWADFSSSHPKAAKWIYQIGMFYLFSLSVTILQYLMFTFLPYIFGIKLAGVEFMWPLISFMAYNFKWNVLGYDIARNSAGEVIIGGGLGYFLSYQIGSFIAQCINFPLQRNITFKSRGNIRFQMFGYLIAWILISLFCNAINGLWLPIAQANFSPAIYNLLVTFITGGVSMIIYFFAYKIIFPEGREKNK